MDKIDYQFVAVPLNLFYCLDNNLRSMLFTLIQISTYKENEAIEKGRKWNGWFLAANSVLAANSNLSENPVRATLDALYLKGIISIQCDGKGKGQNTPPNRIRINWERFVDYEKESIQSCIEDPILAINTPNYKEKGYRPSYLEKKDNAVTIETIMLDDIANDRTSDLAKSLVKIEDNIYNIENKEIIDNKDNIKKIENKNSLEKNNISNISYIDSSLPIKEESIGEYQFNNLINGFSKAKDVDAIIEQFQKASIRLSHLRNEKRKEYVGRISSAITQRCEELGIDTNVIQEYFN